MRFVTSICVGLIAASAAQAGSPSPSRPERPVIDKPLKPAAANPCAAFGPGFAKLEGSSTCVRVGGSIDVGVGGSFSRR